MSKGEKWFRDGILYAQMAYCLCTSQKQFKKRLKEIGAADYEHPFISPGVDGATHFVEGEEGINALVCVPLESEVLNQMGLIVHESMHVWQVALEMIGETDVGSETEAYSVQHIAQRLFTEWVIRQKDLQIVTPDVKK